MAYTDFTARDLQTKLGLHFKAADLFPNITNQEPSDWLTTSLEKAIQMGFANEKSRSERIISPILTELAEHFQYGFAVHSGCNLNADESAGLVGECDFVCSFSRIMDFLVAPAFCMVEAKKQDMEQGTIQCIAQLLGASIFNKNAKKEVPVLYGCTTTGTEWRFIQFKDNVAIVDVKRYFLADLPKLLGILVQIINDVKQYFKADELY